MQSGGVLNYIRTHLRANRDVPTAFKLHLSWQSKDSDGIQSAFEAHSGHSGRIWSGLPFRFSLECDQNVLNAVGMPYEYLECSQSAVRIHFKCHSIYLHFECTSKVLSMSKTLGLATRMGPNIWYALRMQSEFLECTPNIQEYTKNFNSNGIPAHSASGVTRV